LKTVAYPGIFFGGVRGSTNSVEDRGQRERGSGGGNPLGRGSGGSCNLVKEISFHMLNFLNFGYFILTSRHALERKKNTTVGVIAGGEGF
jgi:hypothetical protein